MTLMTVLGSGDRTSGLPLLEEALAMHGAERRRQRRHWQNAKPCLFAFELILGILVGLRIGSSSNG